MKSGLILSRDNILQHLNAAWEVLNEQKAAPKSETWIPIHFPWPHLLIEKTRLILKLKAKGLTDSHIIRILRREDKKHPKVFGNGSIGIIDNFTFYPNEALK